MGGTTVLNPKAELAARHFCMVSVQLVKQTRPASSVGESGRAERAKLSRRDLCWKLDFTTVVVLGETQTKLSGHGTCRARPVSDSTLCLTIAAL